MTAPPIDHLPAIPPSEMVSGCIPMLDISDYLAGVPGARERLGGELRFAFEKVGFYYLRGHDVPQEQIDATFAATARFHALPLETKLKLKVNEHNVGYLPAKGSLPSASKVNVNTKPDLNEAFFVRRQRTPDDPDVIANKRFRGLNQWPGDLPGFRETVLAYMAVMENLGKRMVPLYATALGLPSDWFASFFQQPNLILRMSRYTPPPSFTDNEFSLSPHTDSGFMTLLAPSEVAGLSIRLPDGGWFDAPSIPGTFIVNGGDLLHRWTNGRFLATPHRVINASGRNRYAIPFFFDAHPDTLIECVPTCCSDTDPPRYPPITYHDYAVWFASRTYNHLADIADELPAAAALATATPRPQPAL